MTIHIRTAKLALLVSLISLLATLPLTGQTKDKKYETRAVWLTTIYGLDWPSTTRPASQKRELISMLDELQDLGINTVFLQVRGRGDLIYPSKIEPVNPYFTETGSLSYDPLEFAIKECRKRGMSIHAWVVAIPVGNRTNKRRLGNRHFAFRHPQSVLMYNGTYYMDPSDPETTQHLRAITEELLSNYDLDGIHLDYIRYPEHSLHKIDKRTYHKSDSHLSYEAWRRNNITKVVKGVHDKVHEVDSLAQLSAAVIGTYKSNVPGYDSEIGWNAFSAVQQDPVQWAKEGAIDFIVPMHYRRGPSFWPIIKQWKQVMDSIPILMGLGAYRVLPNEGDWSDREIIDQTTLVQVDKDLQGLVYFRAQQVDNPNTYRHKKLRDENFKKPTLPYRPLSGQIDSLSLKKAPYITELTSLKEGLRVTWQKDSVDDQRSLFVLYASCDSVSDLDIHRGTNLVATTTDHTHVIPWSLFGITSPDNPTKERLLAVQVTRYDLHSGLENVLGKGHILLLKPKQYESQKTETNPTAYAPQTVTSHPVPVAPKTRRKKHK